MVEPYKVWVACIHPPPPLRKRRGERLPDFSWGEAVAVHRLAIAYYKCTQASYSLLQESSVCNKLIDIWAEPLLVSQFSLKFTHDSRITGHKIRRSQILPGHQFTDHDYKCWQSSFHVSQAFFCSNHMSRITPLPPWFQWKPMSSIFLQCCLFCFTRWFNFRVCGHIFKWKLISSISSGVCNYGSNFYSEILFN